MSGISGIGAGGINPYAVQQFQQNLFNQISGGSGSITQSGMEQAVTKAGGTTQAADALYSELDPANTGSVNEQQFAQALPGPPYSSQMQSQMIGYQAQGWPGASTGASATTGASLAQNLFSQIDSNGDGSISKPELEQAVTAAGGTTQAADSLYAKLDPNNTGSVSEQQLSQSLSQSAPHHHHHHGGGGGGNAAGSSAANALTSLFNADGGDTAGTSPTQVAQNIFSQIDSNGDGSISQTEVEQAVTSAGGTTQGADALYSQLDPSKTGSVSEQQFLSALQPPSSSGNTAQDALLALLDQATQNASSTSSVSATSGTTAGTTASAGGGNSAQDALMALLKSFDAAQSNAFGGGNSAQDGLMALLNADNGSANGTGNSGSATGNAADLSLAVSLYQNQLNQQLFSGLGTQSAGI
jgi:Ca2+-binding EF-hand superfamily protein